MIEIVAQKRCPKCGETKPTVNFYKSKDRKDGFQPWCKKCHSDNDKFRRKNMTEAEREKFRQYFREFYAANPEKMREKKRRWKAKHPEKILERKRNRRALKKGNGGKITTKEWRDLLDKYDHRCLRCGRNDVKLTIDHVLPLIKGGPNIIENAQPLCHSCNAWKKDKHIDFR